MTLNDAYRWGLDVWTIWPRYQVHERIALGLFVGLAVYAAYLLTAGRPPLNVVKNDGFEEGVRYWGTGYLEDRLRNGRSPMRPSFPYIVHGTVTSSGEIDTAVHHRDRDLASFRIQHASGRKDDHWGTIAQRLNGLKPHTLYRIRFWVKSKAAEPGAVFVTADLTWGKNHPIQGGRYDWRRKRQHSSPASLSTRTSDS
jgi:hypothetical protein